MHEMHLICAVVFSASAWQWVPIWVKKRLTRRWRWSRMPSTPCCTATVHGKSYLPCTSFLLFVRLLLSLLSLSHSLLPSASLLVSLSFPFPPPSPPTVPLSPLSLPPLPAPLLSLTLWLNWAEPHFCVKDNSGPNMYPAHLPVRETWLFGRHAFPGRKELKKKKKKVLCRNTHYNKDHPKPPDMM